MPKFTQAQLDSLREAKAILKTVGETIQNIDNAITDVEIGIDEAALSIEEAMASSVEEEQAPQGDPGGKDDISMESVRIRNSTGPESVLTVRLTAAGYFVVSVKETRDDPPSTLILTPTEMNALLPMLNRAWHNNDIPF